MVVGVVGVEVFVHLWGGHNQVTGPFDCGGPVSALLPGSSLVLPRPLLSLPASAFTRILSASAPFPLFFLFLRFFPPHRHQDLPNLPPVSHRHLLFLLRWSPTLQ